MTKLERRWRDALMASIIPAPGRGLPALSELELDRFWARFDETAPPHLRLGVRAASVGIGGVLPWLLGYFRTLPALDDDQRDAVLQRALRLPLFADLAKVAKIVASLAYFADPAVQATARGRR